MTSPLLFLALSTLLAEDLACLTAGALVASGRLGFTEATLACFAGIVAGDLGLYLAGRIARRPVRWLVSPQKLESASRWLSKRGAWVILASRFTPGMRLPVYLAAGALRTNALTFCLWFLIASAIWTPILIGLSAWAGNRPNPFWIAAFFTLVLFGRKVPAIIRRYRHWEFWPMWAMYTPLIPWIAILAVRYRSLTLFTAANPGIPGGGFAGESKSAILEHLSPSESVAPAANGRFPLVVKPDVGERGTGVSIVRSDAELNQALSRIQGQAILQQYIPGPEFGVFYNQGRITSITHKVFPSVTGDGIRTLRELILADGRASVIAEVYFRQHDIQRVPAAGEALPLTDIGSHSRGAVFLNATHLRTQALEQRVDQISRTLPGFHFGRYDVRSPSVEAFQRGEFTVLELNGVSAEPTHVYDPCVSLWVAYRTLFQHWAEAFRIGAENRSRGARVTPLRELIAMIRRKR